MNFLGINHPLRNKDASTVSTSRKERGFERGSELILFLQSRLCFDSANEQPALGQMKPFNIFLTGLAAFLACCNPLRSAPLPGWRLYDHQQHDFTIGLPANWSPLTSDEVNEMNETYARKIPNSVNPALHYGYRMTNTETYAFPPVILIRITPKKYPPDIQSVRTEMTDDEGIAGLWVKEPNPIYNSKLDAFICTSEAVFPIEDSPAINSTVAYFRTRNGTIKLYCFVSKNDTDKLAGLFPQVFESIHIRDGTSNHPSRTGLLLGLAATVVVVIVLLRSKPPKTSEPA